MLDENRLTALIEAGMALNSERSLDAVLQKIVEVARTVIGAQYAAVGVLDDDGLLAQFLYVGIDKELADRIGELPKGRGLLGVLIEEGKPLRLRDLSQHPQSVGCPVHHPPMKSFLGVPIAVRGRIFGRLYLTEKIDADEFTEEDERLALTLAAQAGIAIENARLYQDLQRLAASLEEKVAARTKEQSELQRQLVQSEKLAAMGLLSAGVAHEIRTPLSVIRLAAYDVREMLGESNVEAREQLELIERNVLDCNRVIENLLQFAREAKHEPTRLNVNALLKGCLTLAEKDVALQGIQVEEQLRDVSLVFAGEDDFKQVFSNIILNAVQAMPDGGTLTLATSADDSAVEVRISDTGHGIPEELMERIFDPFFTTKEPGKGTGLGLSICRKIIERMNGRIAVESAVGKGTTFIVKLPVEKGQ
jgi:signal transduction histidine kinase